MRLPAILAKLIPTHVFENNLILKTAYITNTIHTGHRCSTGFIRDHFVIGKFLVNEGGDKIHSPSTSLVVNQCPVLIKACEFHDFEGLLIDDFDEVLHIALCVSFRGHFLAHTLKTFVPNLHIAAVLIVKPVFIVLLLLLIGLLVFYLNRLGLVLIFNLLLGNLLLGLLIVFFLRVVLILFV